VIGTLLAITTTAWARTVIIGGSPFFVRRPFLPMPTETGIMLPHAAKHDLRFRCFEVSPDCAVSRA